VDVVLVANFRITDATKDHEADQVVHGKADLGDLAGRVWDTSRRRSSA
jgi:hypothetical protein